MLGDVFAVQLENLLVASFFSAVYTPARFEELICSDRFSPRYISDSRAACLPGADMEAPSASFLKPCWLCCLVSDDFFLSFVLGTLRIVVIIISVRFIRRSSSFLNLDRLDTH